MSCFLRHSVERNLNTQRKVTQFPAAVGIQFECLEACVMWHALVRRRYNASFRQQNEYSALPPTCQSESTHPALLSVLFSQVSLPNAQRLTEPVGSVFSAIHAAYACIRRMLLHITRRTDRVPAVLKDESWTCILSNCKISAVGLYRVVQKNGTTLHFPKYLENY